MEQHEGQYKIQHLPVSKRQYQDEENHDTEEGQSKWPELNRKLLESASD